MNYQEITIKGGAKIWVDLDDRRSACKKCGKMIRFGKTENGKVMPIIEVEGMKGSYQSHFADCSHAKDFRRKRTEDQLDELDKNRV